MFALDVPKTSGAAYVHDIIFRGKSVNHRFFGHTENQTHGSEFNAAPSVLTVGPELVQAKDDGCDKNGGSDLGAHGFTPFSRDQLGIL